MAEGGAYEVKGQWREADDTVVGQDEDWYVADVQGQVLVYDGRARSPGWRSWPGNTDVVQRGGGGAGNGATPGDGLSPTGPEEPIAAFCVAAERLSPTTGALAHQLMELAHTVETVRSAAVARIAEAERLATAATERALAAQAERDRALALAADADRRAAEADKWAAAAVRDGYSWPWPGAEEWQATVDHSRRRAEAERRSAADHSRRRAEAERAVTALREENAALERALEALRHDNAVLAERLAERIAAADDAARRADVAGPRADAGELRADLAGPRADAGELRTDLAGPRADQLASPPRESAS